MRLERRGLRAGIVAIGCIALADPTVARAQVAMPGSGRSLGGYGAATISSYYGGGGGGYIPYNGRASGFVPYRGNGVGAGMGAQTIPRRLPQTPIGGVLMAETPIGGASLSSGMGMGQRGAMGGRPASRALVPFGYEGGIGMGSRMIGTPLTRQGQGGMRRGSGPGFGYPFRMPPSLSGASSSMAMP